jgi:hypothetical protein
MAGIHQHGHRPALVTTSAQPWRWPQNRTNAGDKRCPRDLWSCALMRCAQLGDGVAPPGHNLSVSCPASISPARGLPKRILFARWAMGKLRLAPGEHPGIFHFGAGRRRHALLEAEINADTSTLAVRRGHVRDHQIVVPAAARILREPDLMHPATSRCRDSLTLRPLQTSIDPAKRALAAPAWPCATRAVDHCTLAACTVCAGNVDRCAGSDRQCLQDAAADACCA